MDIRILSPSETGRGWRVYLNEYFIECANQAEAQSTYERAMAATRQLRDPLPQDSFLRKPAANHGANRQQQPGSQRSRIGHR